MACRMRARACFESFPPVLQLQLKRFEYFDFQRDTMVKVRRVAARGKWHLMCVGV